MYTIYVIFNCLPNKREAFVAWCSAVGNNIFDFKSNFRGFVQIIKGLLGIYNRGSR